MGLTLKGKGEVRVFRRSLKRGGAQLFQSSLVFSGWGKVEGAVESVSYPVAARRFPRWCSSSCSDVDREGAGRSDRKGIVSARRRDSRRKIQGEKGLSRDSTSLLKVGVAETSWRNLY
jgi:hypothetical protein